MYLFGVGYPPKVVYFKAFGMFTRGFDLMPVDEHCQYFAYTPTCEEGKTSSSSFPTSFSSRGERPVESQRFEEHLIFGRPNMANMAPPSKRPPSLRTPFNRVEVAVVHRYLP